MRARTGFAAILLALVLAGGALADTWTDIGSVPGALVGNWYADGIWNVGIRTDYVVISNYHWSYLGVEVSTEQPGLYRLIIQNQSIPSQFRGQYYTVLSGTCLEQASTGVAGSEVEAREDGFLEGRFWEVITEENIEPWSATALPEWLEGNWYQADGIWNVGIYADHVQQSSLLWDYVAIEAACDGSLYRLLLYSPSLDAYRGEYFLRFEDPQDYCLIHKGTTGDNLFATEAGLRAAPHLDYYTISSDADWLGDPNWNCGCDGGPFTYLVAPDQSGDFPTIQAAVDAACDGDLILLADGEYTGDGNRDIDTAGKAITISGASADAAAVVLDCQGSTSSPHRGFFIHQAEGAATVIQHLTIRNGWYAAGAGAAPDTTSGGGILVRGAGPSLRDVIIETCHAGDSGALAYLPGSAPSVLRVSDCRFTANTCQDDAAAVGALWSVGVVEGCVFDSNLSVSTAGGFGTAAGPGPIELRDCLFVKNDCERLDGLQAQGGGVNVGAGPVVIIDSCTFACNGTLSGTTRWGGGVFVHDNSNVTIEQSIFFGNEATSDGGTIYCQNASVFVSCCDFFDNVTAGSPDDTYCGIDDGGNFVADPLFCGALCAIEPENYLLSPDSPCLAGNHPSGADCGGIGAFGVCQAPELPVIASILDVPGDQGLMVRATVLPSSFDQPGSDPAITGYAVFRRYDDLPLDRDYPDGDWDYLLTIPASGEDIYHVVLPTLCDCFSGQDCSTEFFVRALTADPYTYFNSSPASGCSVDNLVPGGPANLTLDGDILSWDAVDAPDLLEYRVYLAASSDLDDVTLVTATGGNSVALPDLDSGYLFVTAVDDGGNESQPGEIVTTPVEPVPTAMWLGQNHPNPFNPKTRIDFQLGVGVETDLTIFDLSGRVVRRLLESAFMGEGSHSVWWRGEDDAGNAMAAGVYFYRLKAGDFSDTCKMILLK